MSEQLERIRVMRIIARMNVGGPALQAAGLMRGLESAEFDQRLYTGFVDPDEADYLELSAPDVPFRRLARLGRSVRAADDARALAELVTCMREFRPHIVHTHTAKAGALGRVAAVATRTPVRIHTFHGHLLHGYFPPGKTRLVIGAEQALARITHRLVAVGTTVRDDLVRAGVGRADQYVVIPPGTALLPGPPPAAARASLGLPLDGPVVAFVGRLTRIKRPERFLAVARRVREVIPDATFAVCGHGDLAGAVATQAADLGDGVRLLGWRADVETVYAAADVVMLTSDNEGMPVSLIEAGLAGVPAVATRVGSVHEVVQDGVSGFLTSTDVEELAEGAVRLLHAPGLRREMGVAAQKWCVPRFGAQRLVDDMRQIYSSIAREQGWWPPTAAAAEVAGPAVRTGVERKDPR